MEPLCFTSNVDFCTSVCQAIIGFLRSVVDTSSPECEPSLCNTVRDK